MSARIAAAVVVAIAGLNACGGESDADPVVLRLATADPRGLEHQPALAEFVGQADRVSGGRLRIVLEERRSGGGTFDADERRLVRDVARGAADLGAAATRSLPAMGVHDFEAFDVPGLVDGYRVQAAVLASGLPRRMLPGVRAAGLEGVALLPGPVSRPVGTRAPLLRTSDYRGLRFGVRRSPVADRAVRALGARPVTHSHDRLLRLYLNREFQPGPQAAYEDDLDGLFFDRDGDGRPWVTANIGIWARPVVLVANPRRLRALTPRQQGWLRRAAAAASRTAGDVRDGERMLPAELCAAGIRFAAAPPGAAADLRRAWRPVVAEIARRANVEPVLRDIAALRRRAGPDPALRPPRGCSRARGPGGAVQSALPEGTYRMRITAADVRAGGDNPGGDSQPGTQTLTLRDGRWRLVVTEPGRYVERGSYAGTPLRTLLVSHRAVIGDFAYASVVVGRGRLTFHIGRAPDPFWHVAWASHPWRRIGG